MSVPLKACDRCGGSGRVPREPVKLEDGSFAPLGVRREEVCDRCGGSGALPDVSGAAAPAARKPGYVADQI